MSRAARGQAHGCDRPAQIGIIIAALGTMGAVWNRAGGGAHDDAEPLAGVLSLGRVPIPEFVLVSILAVSMHAMAAVGMAQAAVLAVFASWARDVNGMVAN